MAFNNATRQKFIDLPAMSRPTGGGRVEYQLPKTGLLARLWLNIAGSVAGTLSSPNALGMASIIRRIRLTANSGVDLVNISGAGYHYLLREMLESEYIDATGQSNARSAVTATTFNLDMVLPIMLNLKDPLGLIMLQNEQTILTLSVEWETDSAVATGATVTGACYPQLEIFTVPTRKEDWPPLNVLHQIIEDSQAVSGAGAFTYNVPRGNVLIQMAHGLGIGASGSDGFNAAQFRVQQSEYLDVVSRTQHLDMRHRYYRGRARPAGAIYYDLMASSGLGLYGLTRDVFDTSKVTDIATVITATGAGTLYTLRRQLVTLGAQ